MILVTARAQIPLEHRERFIAIATEMCTASRADDGCLGYRFYADLEQPDHYIIVEEWDRRRGPAGALRPAAHHTLPDRARRRSSPHRPTRSFTPSKARAGLTRRAASSPSTEGRAEPAAQPLGWARVPGSCCGYRVRRHGDRSFGRAAAFVAFCAAEFDRRQVWVLRFGRSGEVEGAGEIACRLHAAIR